MFTPQLILGIVFGIIILGFLAIDLGFFDRKAHKISFKSALWQSIFWVFISVVFGTLVYFFQSPELAFQFFSAYITEKILSVDNLFVILLIFGYFKLEEKYHHKVLFWGILGAIVMRALFIGAGAFLISQFHWILYVFGAILLYSGFKLFFSGGENDHIDLEKNKVIKLAKRFLPFTTEPHHGKFTHIINGKRVFTTLFLAVIVVEATDLIFAVDSIPAAFAISQDPFIVYTSNIFAVMGLRAMFFLLEGIMHKFHHLSKALAFILIFIGVKMLAGVVDIHINSLVSFAIIMGALFISVVASLAFPKKKS
ncbi:MAG: TerC family protein [Patescibacteria group bacterium]